MAETLVRFDNSLIRTGFSARACMAVAGNRRDASVFSCDDYLVATCGCPWFEDPPLAALARRHGSAHAMAEGYRRSGSKLLETVRGAFTLAIVDNRSGEALLAVDRMGVHGLYYELVAGNLVFGSKLDCLDAFPGSNRGVDSQAIYDYVYFHAVPGPTTIRPNRKRLMPGTYLQWRNDTPELGSYWTMRFVENERRPFHHLKEDFRRLLRQSVAEAASAGVAGAFLSGGTDSSTIAGMLGEVTGEPARTYSIGFEAQGYDEMYYARIAARHFGTVHHEYYLTPDDVVDAIPRIATAHEQPFGNSSSVPAYYCALQARRDGVELLLAGDGGDELFGGNARYAVQYLYSLYSDLPAFVRKSLIEPLAFAVPASMGVFGKAQRYIRHASQPMPARYDHYNLVERLGTTSIFTPEFLASLDPERPRVLAEHVYRQAHAASMINRVLAFDLRFTLADNDLPKVVKSCELAGVSVRFPMLDDDLVAFSARLAPALKLKRTRLRYFFKEALRDFLPKEILEKQKHGFGLPFGPWLQAHPRLAHIAFDSLSDLRGRGIIRPEFLDDLINRLLPTHVQYFSTMVWVLMMLEQWFRRSPDAAEASRTPLQAVAS